MSSNKRASSQSAWALLTKGVTSARVKVHRVQQLVNRALKLVEESEEKEHLFAIAGDVITALPDDLVELAAELDATSYALSLLGQDFLKDRLPMEAKEEIEDVTDSVTMAVPSLEKKVASRYLRQVRK